MSQLRQNPATKEWVIIAKERAKRPEDFALAKIPEQLPEYDSKCPFCPGNESQTPKEIFEYRPSGTKPGSKGWRLRAIPNKFAALEDKAGEVPDRKKENDFFRYMDGLGVHEVIIESPRHDLHLAIMEQKHVEEIFLAYRQRYIELSKDTRFEIIKIFKNHGKGAGTSLQHPHSQIIAAPVTPTHIRSRLDEAMRYYDDEGKCVFCEMIEKEKEAGSRIVMETDNFICFEPFASRSPFETYILPKEHQDSFGMISEELTKEFAYITKSMLVKINKSLNNPDYNYMISSTPPHDSSEEYYHWHLRIDPRVTSVAGFEIGSGIYINTVIPEDLRNTPL
ncbi:MAG: galactose-1-phosphate uridylyltransferase [Candidatus Saganbacteria bacterium]|nr:galactose-1-phosphate uridylyltransferase [Candidatus Saganbacteria bacterium]